MIPISLHYSNASDRSLFLPRYLSPPHHAPVSRTHVHRWLARGGLAARRARGAPFAACVQGPGDALLVPDRWAHATLNLRPATVGVTHAIGGSEHVRRPTPSCVDHVSLIPLLTYSKPILLDLAQSLDLCFLVSLLPTFTRNARYIGAGSNAWTGVHANTFVALAAQLSQDFGGGDLRDQLLLQPNTDATEGGDAGGGADLVADTCTDPAEAERLAELVARMGVRVDALAAPAARFAAAPVRALWSPPHRFNNATQDNFSVAQFNREFLTLAMRKGDFYKSDRFFELLREMRGGR